MRSSRAALKKTGPRLENLPRTCASESSWMVTCRMEWVFFSKFDGCGTQPGAVRAEIVAANRLSALKARKARRAQLCRAEEDRLVHLSRSDLLALLPPVLPAIVRSQHIGTLTQQRRCSVVLLPAGWPETARVARDKPGRKRIRSRRGWQWARIKCLLPARGSRNSRALRPCSSKRRWTRRTGRCKCPNRQKDLGKTG